MRKQQQQQKPLYYVERIELELIHFFLNDVVSKQLFCCLCVVCLLLMRKLFVKTVLKCIHINKSCKYLCPCVCALRKNEDRLSRVGSKENSVLQ